MLLSLNRQLYSSTTPNSEATMDLLKNKKVLAALLALALAVAGAYGLDLTTLLAP